MRLLGRQFWIIRFFGIAAAAAMAGSAVSSALALVIIDGTASVFAGAGEEGDADDEPDDDDAAALASVAGRPRDAAASRDATASRRGLSAAASTLDRYNPFCPGCVDASQSGVVVLAQGPGEPTSPAARTRLPLRLHATMEAERTDGSLATIYDVERTVVGVYGIGDEVRPGVSLLSVAGGHVVLRSAAGDERLDLGAPVVEPPPAVAEPKTKPVEKPAAVADELDAISCATEDVCTVERAFVDEILNAPGKFASQAPRVMPMPDGGFKISGVRKGSLAKKLGLANGDVLVSVNGAEIKGIDDALALMTKLRRASNLEVLLDRKGKTVRKQIEIR